MFHTDADRTRFLELLGATVQRFDWILTAYVLMSNHFHFVIELTAANFSRGIQWLNGKYAQWFNRNHERVGHLFQDRPDARLVDKENYLLRVLRYDVLNPVRAHMVESPGDYEWSSYRATAGLAPAPDWLATDEVLRLFGVDRRAAEREYRQFVHAGITDRPWDDLVGQIYLGSDTWRDEVRERVQLKPRDSEHTYRQRNVGGRSMADVVSSVSRALDTDPGWIRAGRGTVARSVAAWLGRYEADLTLPEIAAGLRLRSAGHVSRLIRDCDTNMNSDENLRGSLDRCLNALHTLWRSDERKI